MSSEFEQILDISTFEIILALFCIVLITFVWVNFRLRICKSNIPRITRETRNKKVNKLFKVIFISSPLLIIFGHLDMALPGLMMLIYAGGGRLSYKTPKLGMVSYQVDCFSNEIVSVKAHEVYDEAGMLRPLDLIQVQLLSSNMKKTTGLFKSRLDKRQAIIANEEIHNRNSQLRAAQTVLNEKVIADQIKRRSLVTESIQACKKNIVWTLFYAYIFISIVKTIIEISLVPLMKSIGFPVKYIPSEKDFIEILFVNYFAYGLIILFVIIAVYSANSGIELLRISRLNKPRYFKIGTVPETITSKLISVIKSKPSHKQAKRNISGHKVQDSRLNQVNSPVVALVMQQQIIPPPVPPPGMQQQIIPPPVPPPGMQQKAMILPPVPPPGMQQKAMILPPIAPHAINNVVMGLNHSSDSKMVLGENNQQNNIPPLPPSGLPEGWTSEQWKFYGERWINHNNSSK